MRKLSIFLILVVIISLTGCSLDNNQHTDSENFIQPTTSAIPDNTSNSMVISSPIPNTQKKISPDKAIKIISENLNLHSDNMDFLGIEDNTGHYIINWTNPSEGMGSVYYVDSEKGDVLDWQGNVILNMYGANKSGSTDTEINNGKKISIKPFQVMKNFYEIDDINNIISSGDNDDNYQIKCNVDLNSDGNKDIIECHINSNGESTIKIGDSTLSFATAWLKKDTVFNIVDLDKSDNFTEIAIKVFGIESFYYKFFRYTGDDIVDLAEIDDDILLNQNGILIPVQNVCDFIDENIYSGYYVLENNRLLWVDINVEDFVNQEYVVNRDIQLYCKESNKMPEKLEYGWNLNRISFKKGDKLFINAIGTAKNTDENPYSIMWLNAVLNNENAINIYLKILY